MHPLMEDNDFELHGGPCSFGPSNAARNVLSASTIEGWLDCSLLRFPFFSLALDGKPVAPEETCSTRIVGGHADAGYVDAVRVRALMERGATLVLANLHEWHAPARDLCRALAELHLAKVGAVAFWTAAANRGLRVHRDDCHVFVVQLAGRKRWSLYDVPSETSAFTPGYADETKLGAPKVVDLAPGQALFIPEGQAHTAAALDEASLHVSFTVREPRLHDVVALAIKACLASVPEHTALSGERDDREAQARAILGRLGRALGRVDVPALVSSIEKRAIEARGTF